MIDEASNRLLMSDSLKGMIPALEEEHAKVYVDSFVMASLQLDDSKDADVLTGNLIGISFERLDEIKIDIRMPLNEAYETIKKYTSSRLSCRMLYMHLGNDEIRLEGPYRISSPKMLDLDNQNKMCTLGADLIKETI